LTNSPPYILTPDILQLVSEISELVGRLSVRSEEMLTPQLRRENHIKTIHSSLAIENNTLSLEQVSAVLDGNRVLGLPREILEVQNAFKAYGSIQQWKPSSIQDLLKAHSLMMKDLIEEPGSFRKSGVGVYKNGKVVHIALPATRVPELMDDLFHWLRYSKENPLITSSVVHYELEFIHPFADGNGRMGRLWQTIVLNKWRSLMLYVPIETVIKSRQTEYYQNLEKADRSGSSTCFIHFMLESIFQALNEMPSTDQVSDQVKTLLQYLRKSEMSVSELMEKLHLSHRSHFRKNHIEPAELAGLIEKTQPKSPNSPTQKYRLTVQGLNVLKRYG
jgi:Fic family protein